MSTRGGYKTVYGAFTLAAMMKGGECNNVKVCLQKDEPVCFVECGMLVDLVKCHKNLKNFNSKK